MRKRMGLIILAAVVVVLIPLAASAGISLFEDVADDNIFVHDINWMKANDVTRGCNPPANTMYCPGDNVTRQQMAAFMRRLAVNRVVDAGTLEGLAAAAFLGATATAVDSDFLDGKDSTEFAADMQWVVESQDLTLSSGDEDTVTVDCPAGKNAISGGGVEGGALFAMTDNFPQPDGWGVSWLNLSDSEETGGVLVFAMCVSGNIGVSVPFAELAEALDE